MSVQRIWRWINLLSFNLFFSSLSSLVCLILHWYCKEKSCLGLSCELEGEKRCPKNLSDNTLNQTQTCLGVLHQVQIHQSVDQRDEIHCLWQTHHSCLCSSVGALILSQLLYPFHGSSSYQEHVVGCYVVHGHELEQGNQVYHLDSRERTILG